MQAYELKSDFTDQRRGYLSVLIGSTLVIGVIVFFITLSQGTLSLPTWIGVTIGLLLAFALHQRQNIQVASWCYLIGLLVTFATALAGNGPSSAFAFLLILPVVLASVLLNDSQIIWMAALTVGAMFIGAHVRTDTETALTFTLAPALFCAALVTVLVVNARNMMNIVFWATDLQKKDSRRAEMFYEKSEQLVDALRQLTHANSRLELLNKQLEEAQNKAEQASRAKSVFLSNMSHELRTPLNVIIGYTSTMLDMPEMYANEALSPVYRADVQLIKDNGYYLLGLINDILDLSKIEAGKLELHCQPVDLPDMFRGIVSTSIGLVKDKPLQIRPDFADNLPLVWADPIRTRQIILNLMSNAVKFTETGSVTLHAHLVDHSVQISVTDTGIGIAEKSLGHIFDRFQQAEHDTDKHYGGTGLGLDISRQLARMHGGDLTVQSTLGRGSTFSFTLPLLDGAQRPVEADEATLSSVKALRSQGDSVEQIFTVLLAEDEVSMRDMMRRTLEEAGFVIVDVQDGAEVLDMATGLLPDLIILDVRLPNVDGWQILSSLKQNADAAPIPVLMSTVNEDKERAMQLGASLYLRKPFSPDELLSCVQALLPYSLGAGEAH